MSFINFIQTKDKQLYADMCKMLSYEFISQITLLAEEYMIGNGTGDLPEPVEEKKYVKKCLECGETFETEHEDNHICDSCFPF